MGSNRLLLWGVGVLLALVLVVGGSFYFSSSRPWPPKAGRTPPAANPEEDEPDTPNPSVAIAEPERLADTPEHNSLTDEERRYLWDIERAAQALDVDTFPRLARAIRERDHAGIAAFLSEDFSGQVPDQGRQRVVTHGFGQFASADRDDQSWLAADREEFIGFLTQQRQRLLEPRVARAEGDKQAPTEFLSRDPQVEVRLMRLSPVEWGKTDGPWHGTLKVRFAGKQTSDEPGELELSAHFTLDAPGRDIAEKTGWMKTCNVYSSRWRQSTAFLMTEVGSDRGIDRSRFHDNWLQHDKPPLIVSGGVYVCDYNKDGRDDVLITDPNGTVLYQASSDGTFVDATESSGLTGQLRTGSQAAIFVDLDGDGFEDLIIGNQIFRNNRDATFSDYTALSNLRPPIGSAMAVADYDLDGRMDVYFLRASPGPIGRSRISWVDDQTGPGNELWRNMGNWRFRNVTGAANASAGHRSCFAGVWLDANLDGLPDLAVSDEFGSSVLLVNNPDGKFTEHVLKQPFGGFCMGIAAGDITGDGYTDVYLANMASKAGDRIISNLPSEAYTPEVRAKVKEFVRGNELLRNIGGGAFEPLGSKLGVTGPGWSYGTALVDLDNDGWLDIYAPGGFISYSRGEPDG